MKIGKKISNTSNNSTIDNGITNNFSNLYNKYPEYIPSSPIFTQDVNVIIDGKSYPVSLWDVPFIEFQNLRRLNYQEDTDIIVFSLINPISFEYRKCICARNQNLLSKSKIYSGWDRFRKREDPNILKELKEKNVEPISYSEGERMAFKIKAQTYIECSCKTLKNIKFVFEEAIRTLIYPKQYPNLFLNKSPKIFDQILLLKKMKTSQTIFQKGFFSKMVLIYWKNNN